MRHTQLSHNISQIQNFDPHQDTLFSKNNERINYKYLHEDLNKRQKALCTKMSELLTILEKQIKQQYESKTGEYILDENGNVISFQNEIKKTTEKVYHLNYLRKQTISQKSMCVWLHRRGKLSFTIDEVDYIADLSRCRIKFKDNSADNQNISVNIMSSLMQMVT